MSDDWPGIWSVIWGLVAVAFVATGLFGLEEATDRMFAILIGFHFANRSEIAALKRRVRG